MIKVSINYYGCEEIRGEFNNLAQVNKFLEAFDLQRLKEIDERAYYDEGKLVMISII